MYDEGERPTAPAPPTIVTIEKQARGWRWMGCGLLVGSLLIGAPLGGAVGGIAGATVAQRNAPAQPAAPAQSSAPIFSPIASSSGLDIAQLYSRSVPAVALVRVTTGAGASATGGLGTAFLVDGNGHLLTNNHVVNGARTISVTFRNGETVSARLLGTDPAEDLAVLKIDPPSGVTPLAFADSDRVTPGEPAVAIGNPVGLTFSVSAGIVSATSRDYGQQDRRPLRGLIQTDAPINPGNSGGPLLNGRGEVIGITTLNIFTEQETGGGRPVNGLGLAVPSNTAKRLLPRMIAGEKIEHAYLGVSASPERSNDGVRLGGIVAGNPAAAAGLREGDIITKVGGKPTKDIDALRDTIDSFKPGETVEIEFLRDGRTQTAKAKLVAWPSTARSG